MRVVVLKSKLHLAMVTGANLDYEGSIAIDRDLMDAVGIREWEKVLVANFTNGNRYETYVITAPAGSGEVSVNGAGARYSCVGDRVTIFAFAEIDEREHAAPRIALLDEQNRVVASRQEGVAAASS